MKRNFSLIIGLAALLCVIVTASFTVNNLRHNHRAEQLDAQKRAIERAAVLCYALEGAYPPTVDYLEEHYGLQINRNRYIVHYQTIGSNIRPDIVVYAYE